LLQTLFFGQVPRTSDEASLLQPVSAIFGKDMLLPKMAIIGNNNNNSQIIAKVGNKMVTLSLYRNLSHIFAIFGNILLPKVAKNGNFY